MRTLVNTFTNSSEIIRLMSAMTEDGLSESFNDHFQDMFEYMPRVPDNRSMWMYLNTDGKVDLEINCYGIEIKNTFQASERLLKYLKEGRVTHYLTDCNM